MMNGMLSAAANDMGGALHGDDTAFCGVSTDTRSLQPGELFVALRGPNFDGVEFVDQAESGRAAGAVVDRRVVSKLPTIIVGDTLQALGKLAAAWRAQMPATVIGITGSNGKTTLKELLASCLSIAGETLATRGNLNNEIGVPLMLARMSRDHRFAVIEMGANHHGEIAYLCSLATPAVVAITNAAPAHLEGFGSVEGVARAKGEILAGEPAPEFAILNADDDYFDYWRSICKAPTIVSFGLSEEADFRASDINAGNDAIDFSLHMPDGRLEVHLALAGEHNVLNACAAAAIARTVGLDAAGIRQGLEAVRPVGGRLAQVTGATGARLYDDSYNANPVSVRVAAEFLAAQDGTSWLVLGDMAELGDDAARLHAEAGRVIREAGVLHLLATGPLSRKAVEAYGAGGRWFETVDELTAVLRDAVAEGDVVLVKGSRSMGMERVVHALRDTGDTRIPDKARRA